MKFDTSNFRARYRAETHPLYNAWLHAGFVLVFGVLAIAFLWSHAEHVQPWEWLALPVGLIVQNWGEYMVHKHLGHHKRPLSALFYKRHTGDHHSFFSYGQMSYEHKQDWRVIFFPPWLIVVVSLGVLGGWWVLSALNGNAAALFSGALLVGCLSYEILHAFEHLPDQHPISRLPWIRQMRRLHELHHARDLMHTHNFNIVFPLWDWLLGTLYWQAEEPLETRKNSLATRHSVDLQQSPNHVLPNAALSLKLFAIYLALLGATLALLPNPLLRLFLLPETSEVWIRVAGVLAFNIGIYYWYAANAQSPGLFLASVYTRSLILATFTAFVLAGMAKPVLILFGSVDFLGGIWTLLALRADQRKAAGYV